jgi:sensor histidine kinase regulating citrate/malate metabolism
MDAKGDTDMAEDSLVLEQLRKIRAELDAARERDHEIMMRLSGIEVGLTRITRDEAGNYAKIIQDRHAIDRIRERLERIERRLELAD